jgi:hypothetical protein
MQAVRQDMVSSETWNSEDLPHLQNQILGHAKKTATREMFDGLNGKE